MQKKITFAESGQKGLGFKIVVSCVCGRGEICSGPLSHAGYEINKQLVLVMRLLGIGRGGLNFFCGFMDLCRGLSSGAYERAVMQIHAAASAVFETLTKKAVEEEKIKNGENGQCETHFIVSGDGSWKKRGFTSLYGVMTLIGYYSGKVLDLVVKSSSCYSV